MEGKRKQSMRSKTTGRRKVPLFIWLFLFTFAKKAGAEFTALQQRIRNMRTREVINKDAAALFHSVNNFAPDNVEEQQKVKVEENQDEKPAKRHKKKRKHHHHHKRDKKED